MTPSDDKKAISREKKSIKKPVTRATNVKTNIAKRRIAKKSPRLMNQLDEIVTLLSKDLSKNSQKIVKLTNLFMKNHPYLSTGTTLVLGALITLLLSKSEILNGEKDKIKIPNHSLRHLVTDKTVEQIMDQIKVPHYIKEYPIQATGTALGVGALLALLLHR